MAVNPDKLLSTIFNRFWKLKDCHKLLIDNHEIDSENSIALLDIEIEKKQFLKTCYNTTYVRKLAAK